MTQRGGRSGRDGRRGGDARRGVVPGSWRAAGATAAGAAAAGADRRRPRRWVSRRPRRCRHAVAAVGVAGGRRAGGTRPRWPSRQGAAACPSSCGRPSLPWLGCCRAGDGRGRALPFPVALFLRRRPQGVWGAARRGAAASTNTSPFPLSRLVHAHVTAAASGTAGRRAALVCWRTTAAAANALYFCILTLYVSRSVIRVSPPSPRQVPSARVPLSPPHYRPPPTVTVASVLNVW